MDDVDAANKVFDIASGKSWDCADEICFDYWWRIRKLAFKIADQKGFWINGSMKVKHD